MDHDDIKDKRKEAGGTPDPKRVQRNRPEVGLHPPLIYLGGDLGLKDGEPWIDLADMTGHRYVCHSVEAVLRVVDLFQEPGRTSLLADAAVHLGLSPYTLLGRGLEL